MSRFTEFSEKSFFYIKKSEINTGSDAISLNFLKKLASTDCSMFLVLKSGMHVHYEFSWRDFRKDSIIMILEDFVSQCDRLLFI